MKLQYLHYFSVLAEELHFRRAASRLAMSQPPLSAAIKSLEEELGAQLFLRNSKMVRLTPAGAAFLEEARQILGSVSRLASVVRAVEEGTHGRLDVGMAGSLMFREVPAILDRFKNDAPGVDVVLHEIRSAEQLDRLQRGQLHAAFVHGATVPPPLKSLSLQSDVYVVCLPATHGLAGHAVVDLRDMADEQFVMFSRDGAPANHDNVIAIFSRAGIHPRTVHQARTWLTIIAMVSRGHGVALVPKSLAETNMAGVRFIPFKGAPAAAPAMVAWNPAFATPTLQAFIDSAARTIRSRGAVPPKRARR